MSDNIRVRYSGMTDRGQRQPKNTLITQQVGDIIYFGIARCKLEEDNARKDEGKKWAKERLYQAAGMETLGYQGTFSVDGAFHLHSSGLLGKVNVGEVKKLVDYFENIDSIMYEKDLEIKRNHNV